jgi:transcriptional regulator of arginine metabolism
MVRKRSNRQEAIREIVREGRIRVQREFVVALQGRGFDCTQATVSRDIAEMGLEKLPDGVYVLAEDLHLKRMVSEMALDVQCSDNLVLVKTVPGSAPGVATAIESAEVPDILGSVAGDDTIILVTADKTRAVSVRDAITKIIPSKSSDGVRFAIPFTSSR